MDDIQYNVLLLRDLFFRERLPGEGIAATCRRIAAKLNEFAPNTRHWGGEYIHEVLHEKLPLSKNLAAAISNVHSATLKNDVSQLEAVIVLASPGMVIPNSVVNCASKICNSKVCNRPFVPINTKQKYCSPACRRLSPKTR